MGTGWGQVDKQIETQNGNTNTILSLCISTTAEEPLEFEMHLD